MSLETEGEDDTDQDTTVPLGRPNQVFEFSIDAPCQVRFVEGSAKDGNLEEIQEFLQS